MTFASLLHCSDLVSGRIVGRHMDIGFSDGRLIRMPVSSYFCNASLISVMHHFLVLICLLHHLSATLVQHASMVMTKYKWFPSLHMRTAWQSITRPVPHTSPAESCISLSSSRAIMEMRNTMATIMATLFSRRSHGSPFWSTEKDTVDTGNCYRLRFGLFKSNESMERRTWIRISRVRTWYTYVRTREQR